MGLLDNYTGIGMTPCPIWRHQNVIRSAMLNASKELEDQDKTDTWLTFDEYELMARYLHMPLLNYLESRF